MLTAVPIFAIIFLLEAVGCPAQANEGAADENANANICQLPPVTGNCRAFFRHWFYNATAAECQQFVYGGCGGNANNFAEKAACTKECGDNKGGSASGDASKHKDDSTDEVFHLSRRQQPPHRNPCKLINCGECRRCVPEPKQCFTLPCDQYRCEDKPGCDASETTTNPCLGNPCGYCNICKPDPFIRCIRAPCPQYTCSPNPECGPCVGNPCGDGSTCVPEPKQCFTTPCPQYRCEKPET